MKIIDIGIVIDVNDPKNIGRVRFLSYDTKISALQKSYTGPAWDKKDPFIALPFLPMHINIIPQKDSSIKIIRYVAESEGLVNAEYIPGPFTTAHDFTSQQYSEQLTYTSYGVAATPKEDVKSYSNDKNAYEDNYIDPRSIGTMVRSSDVAINGNYGSDLLLTEGGAQLRAGKFVPKETNSIELKKKLDTFPIRGRRDAKLSLKKFPYRAELVTKKININGIDRSDLSYVVEYDINNFTTPTGVTLNIYKIKSSEGDLYKTDKFDDDTALSTGSSSLMYNVTIPITSIHEAYIEVRNFIHSLDREKMITLAPSLPDSYAHPFYFRPVATLKNRVTTLPSEESAKSTFLSGISVGIRVTSGLFFSRTSTNPGIVHKVKTIQYVQNRDVVLNNKGKIVRQDYLEESISSLISDKIYFLSTEKNGVGENKIDFPNLSKYELNQIDYYQNIGPKTFSIVRGEILIDLLEKMVDMLLNHQHGILTTPYWPKDLKDSIRDLRNRMNEDMVNQSLRIN
jgi:hypothetical protein